jgi:hypothetical protein
VNRRHALDWTVAAAVEVATGLVLIIRPSLAGWLLFGAELSDAGQALGRLAGFALLALALAYWPVLGAERRSAVRALLILSLFTTIYLVYLGVRGEPVGILLWPAAALHAALTVLLVRGWLNRSQ